MRIKRTGLCIAAILILTLGCVMSSIAKSSGFAAKVNGVAIKDSTLEAALDNFVQTQKMMGVAIKEEDQKELQEDILEQLISAELLYQESKKADLGDLTAEIDKQFEAIKKGFVSEGEFKKVLDERGVTEEDLRYDITKGVYIGTFLDKKLYTDIVITEEEKRQEYENNTDKLEIPEYVKASHILVLAREDTSPGDKEKARQKIEALRREAISGRDFAELARENSEDGSASQGGDLGYFSRGDMVKPFEDATFSLQKGEISKVVESPFGYHIIKLTDRKAPHTLTYEEIAPEIENFLLNKRKGEQVDRFVDELKGKAQIERY